MPTFPIYNKFLHAQNGVHLCIKCTIFFEFAQHAIKISPCKTAHTAINAHHLQMWWLHAKRISHNALNLLATCKKMLNYLSMPWPGCHLARNPWREKTPRERKLYLERIFLRFWICPCLGGDFSSIFNIFFLGIFSNLSFGVQERKFSHDSKSIIILKFGWFLMPENGFFKFFPWRNFFVQFILDSFLALEFYFTFNSFWHGIHVVKEFSFGKNFLPYPCPTLHLQLGC